MKRHEHSPQQAGLNPGTASAACLLTALALLASLAGCGGGGGEQSIGPSTDSAGLDAPAISPKRGKQEREGADNSKQNSLRRVARQDAAVGDPVPGAKAIAPGVPVTRGGDNSIQSFGAEGQASPRDQAAENLNAYLSAFSAADWARACSLASTEYRQDLARLIAQAKMRGGATKPQGCAATLAALLGKASKGALAAYRLEQVLSFRIEGDHAYLIYRSADGRAMFIAMADDAGSWKVNVPRPEAFQFGSGR